VAKILCVDDDPGVISLKKIILEKAGYEVTTCTSAEGAIRLIERVAFDGVVTDWRLGRERGRAIVEAAKAHHTVPVVVVSGYVAEAFQAAEPLADIYLESLRTLASSCKYYTYYCRRRRFAAAIFPLSRTGLL